MEVRSMEYSLHSLPMGAVHLTYTSIYNLKIAIDPGK
jgi:hypothetical protein